ncbi:MAG TPA: AsmA family protein, partial [Blastocatellia bacterium]|nr:AsmA family protein [Blastocatellia bacterium]
MRRKVLIGAIILLSLVLLLVISAIIYVRSGRLDLYLRDQVIAGLQDAGIRAEIGSTHLDLNGYKVSLGDIRLFSRDGKKAIGEIESISAEFSVVSYLRQEISIKRVEINGPHIWIEYDKQGRLNLADLQGSEPKKERKESGLNIAAAVFEVTKGRISFADVKRDIALDLPGLGLSLKPLDDKAVGDNLNHQFALVTDAGTGSYQGRNIQKISLHAAGSVTETNAELSQFELASDLGKASLSGKIESFRPIKYSSSDVRIDAALDQVSRVFAPDTHMSGNVGFNGRVEGTDADYHAQASLDSSGLSVEGIRVAGLRLRTSADGTGDEYKATAALSTSSVSGRDFTIQTITLGNARVQGKSADFDLTGALALASLKSGTINLTGLRGELSADPDKVRVSQLSARVLGGTVTGSASVAYAGGSSDIDLQFKGADLAQATTLASAKEVDVRGAASGTAKFSFPGLNFKAATGRVDATLDATVSPTEPGREGVTGNGQIALIARAGTFTLERATIHTKHSELTASGPITRDGSASLDISFRSEDMSEVWRAIEAFGVI